MTTLEQILVKHGPMMSGILAEKLAKAEKIPLNTASQKISRTKAIKKIKGFFVSNQSLCFLNEQYKDEQLYTVFSKALYDNGRKYWYCMNALKVHGGIINTKFLECYTNYPVLPLKKHLPFKKVMQKFVAQGVLVFNGTDEYYFAPRFCPIDTSSLTHRTIETIKEDILSHFHSLLRNTGLISYNTGELFGEFGKFRWGFKGASYIRGLVSNKQPGFVLADILFGKKVYKDDVLFYIEKLNHIQSFKNSPRVVPFLIVDNVHISALEELKKNGVALGLISELFGEKYANALNELVSILNNAGANLKSQPNKYLELISELKIFNETLVFNIRGTLFEYFVGHIHSRNSQSIDIGREILENNGRHEIDVFVIYDSKVVFCECKATNSKIDIDKVTKWRDIKIPAFRTWLLKQETLKNHDIEFEYWATGGFTDDAKAALDKFIAGTKKFKVSYYEPDKIRETVIKMKNKKLKEALDTYFLKAKV
jgi:hypothetical protein